MVVLLDHDVKSLADAADARAAAEDIGPLRGASRKRGGRDGLQLREQRAVDAIVADANYDIAGLLIEDEVQHVGELSDEILQRFAVTCRICHGYSPLHGQAQSRPNVGSLTSLSGERQYRFNGGPKKAGRGRSRAHRNIAITLRENAAS